MDPTMPDLDFDNLCNLAKNNPLAFELERTRIIGTYIRGLSGEQRAKAIKFQTKLDAARMGMTSKEFLAYCVDEMEKSISKLEAIAREVRTYAENQRIEAAKVAARAGDNVVFLDAEAFKNRRPK